MSKKVNFQIKSRAPAKTIFDCKIEALVETPFHIRLGLAVRSAVEVGADLRGADLRGANLRGAYLGNAYLREVDLNGAYLRGAYLGGSDLRGANLGSVDLNGAYLNGANLNGVYLSGDKIKRVLAIAERLDCYSFHAFELEDGRVKIKAGCRWLTPDEYRAHVAARYPNTDKEVETLTIIDFIEHRAREMGCESEKATERGGVCVGDRVAESLAAKNAFLKEME